LNQVDFNEFLKIWNAKWKDKLPVPPKMVMDDPHLEYMDKLKLLSVVEGMYRNSRKAEDYARYVYFITKDEAALKNLLVLMLKNGDECEAYELLRKEVSNLKRIDNLALAAVLARYYSDDAMFTLIKRHVKEMKKNNVVKDKFKLETMTILLNELESQNVSSVDDILSFVRFTD